MDKDLLIKKIEEHFQTACRSFPIAPTNFLRRAGKFPRYLDEVISRNSRVSFSPWRFSRRSYGDHSREAYATRWADERRNGADARGRHEGERKQVRAESRATRRAVRIPLPATTFGHARSPSRLPRQTNPRSSIMIRGRTRTCRWKTFSRPPVQGGQEGQKCGDRSATAEKKKKKRRRTKKRRERRKIDIGSDTAGRSSWWWQSLLWRVCGEGFNALPAESRSKVIVIKRIDPSMISSGDFRDLATESARVSLKRALLLSLRAFL